MRSRLWLLCWSLALELVAAISPQQQPDQIAKQEPHKRQNIHGHGHVLPSCISIRLHALQQREQASRGRGSKRKLPVPSTRHRLAKRLLGPRGRDAALGELHEVEGEVWRERESNNW